jgi:hypothetical protein
MMLLKGWEGDTINNNSGEPPDVYSLDFTKKIKPI